MTLHDDDSATADSELLSEIGSALSVEHGSAFGAGVHARIRRSRQRRFAAGGALALAASAVLAVWVSRPEPTPFGAPELAVVVSALKPRPSYGRTPAEPRSNPGRATNEQDFWRYVARAGSQARVARTTRPASTVKAAPVASAATQEYVVVTNQLEILQGLWARQKGRPMQEVVGDAAAAPDATSEASNDPRRPVVIDPVRVWPVVIGEPARLPVGVGTPIIRRAFAAAETR